MSDIPSLLLVLIVTTAAVWVLITYNRFVGLRNQVDAAWSDVDVQLKRRHDLVPVLVQTVTGYVRHEQSTLEQVMNQRAEALAAIGPRAQFQSEQGVADGVSKVMAIAEAYPALKAGENFLKLQADLIDIEDHIQHARRYYNGAVKLNNTLTGQFPALLVARLFGFREAQYFDAQIP